MRRRTARVSERGVHRHVSPPTTNPKQRGCRWAIRKQEHDTNYPDGTTPAITVISRTRRSSPHSETTHINHTEGLLWGFGEWHDYRHREVATPVEPTHAGPLCPDPIKTRLRSALNHVSSGWHRVSEHRPQQRPTAGAAPRSHAFLTARINRPLLAHDSVVWYV